jgi:hypothetical protein
MTSNVMLVSINLDILDFCYKLGKLFSVLYGKCYRRQILGNSVNTREPLQNF